MNFNRKIKHLSQVIVISFITFSALATTVKIGAYVFPPYFERVAGGKYQGVIPEFIENINKFQADFKFELYETSPKRRYQDFTEEKFDGIFFESPEWGWGDHVSKGQLVFEGDVVLDGEVFISGSNHKGDNDYFKNLEGKSIGLYLGYHYKFADFNSDEHFLKEKFNAFVSSSHDRNIERVYNNRLDMAIVTKLYIKKYMNEHPRIASKIFVSDVIDQDYRLKFGLRKSLSLKESKISKIINDFLKSNEYREIIKKYSLE